MALLGRAAVAIFSDMRDAQAHDHWHSHEHMPERIGIPGFLRARRCVALEGESAPYFVLYEVRDAAVMTSSAYLERLNHPSEWTQRTMSEVISLNRTLCGVASSHGHGVGGLLLTLGFEAAFDGVSDPQLAEIAARPGLTGAHLLQRDHTTERPRTHEEQLRGRPDGSVETLLLVEGYDQRALREVREKHGRHAVSRAIYAQAHLMVPDDLRQS